MTSIAAVSTELAREGVAFAPQIAQAAQQHGLDPRLLAAVAAQETGGPGANAGRNVVGDGGHGHGVFQIDDRWHDFAKTAQAMDPGANAQYAAGMIRGALDRYGGDVRKALSSYNAGSPGARGTATQWSDGNVLGYADSVLRHYRQLGGDPAGGPAQSTGPSICALPDLGSLLDEAIAQSPATLGNVNALAEHHNRTRNEPNPLDRIAGDDFTDDGDDSP